MADYAVRLPGGTPIDDLDRFQIIVLEGTPTTINIEIVGPVHQGLTAVTFKGKVIVDGS